MSLGPTTTGASPSCYLNNLPAELLFSILEVIDPLDLPAFLCANFTILSHHRIVWPLSPHEAYAIRRLNHPSLRLPKLGTGRAPVRSCLARLPPELRAFVNRYLSTEERIKFAMATWPIYQELFY